MYRVASVFLTSTIALLTVSSECAAQKVFSGTAFAVSRDGFVVTNAHVVPGCSEISAQQAGNHYTATLVARDEKSDLALIRISTPTKTYASLRQSPVLRAGEQATTFGFPLSSVLASDGNITSGSVSSLRGIGDDNSRVQITTPIQSGNSGGALLDSSGNVIGVVVAKFNALASMRYLGDMPQNVNFAVALDTLKDFLKSNKVAVVEAPSIQPRQLPDIGDSARQFTYQVFCKVQEAAASAPDDWIDPDVPTPKAESKRAVASEVAVDVGALKISDLKQVYPLGIPEVFQIVISNAGSRAVRELTVGFLTQPGQRCPTSLAGYDGLKKFSVRLEPGDSVTLEGKFSGKAKSFCIVRAIGPATMEDRIIETLNKGLAYAKSGDLDGAISIFAEVTQVDAGKYGVLAYFYRGTIYGMRAQHDRAAAEYSHAIAIDPKNSTLYFRRGNANIQLGKYEQASRDFADVIALRPDSAAAYYSRGRAYFFLGSYKNALSDYARAIDLKPDFMLAYNNRAWTLVQAGRASEGLPDAERAIELDPDSAIALDTRAHIYEALGNTKQAIADYRRALKLLPTQKETIDGLTRLGALP